MLRFANLRASSERLLFSPPRLFRPAAPQFSTSRAPRLPSPKPKDAPSSTKPEVEIPTFSFQALGLSRNMKVFVIGLLSVWGTFETYFYYRAFTRWYYGEEKEA